jgi:hypothetical protein
MQVVIMLNSTKKLPRLLIFPGRHYQKQRINGTEYQIKVWQKAIKKAGLPAF